MSPRGDVEIAPAVEADLGGLVDGFAATAAEGRWIATEAPIDREAYRTKFSASIHDPNSLFLVARDDGKVVGQLSLRPGWPGVLDLGMAIDEAWRGRGVGSALMERAIEWARATGAHKITLHVYPHNAAAIALYEKYGFVREGLFRNQMLRKNGELWDTIPMGLLLR